jgi:4-hydroxyphenylacetate decarboxylase small subunit
MNKQLRRHCDCRNYAPVDVVKGICHRTKQLILGDEDQCEQYAQLDKCKYCEHFAAAEEEFMGSCSADAAKPWTYPDLIAITCASFKGRD